MPMAVLRVRDKDGNVTEILSIKGEKGETPVKGVDYFTEADKAELSDVIGGEYSGDNVFFYGAVGDGETDSTQAFKSALAMNRRVFVPAGTFKLSGEIVIGENCSLELSQDTVLDFTKVDGNCITLGMSSTLKGNHATVKVPYEFGGNVLFASSATTADTSAMPPFTKWDPMWKSGRYVTDINICKADYRGFHYSVDGTCSGTAVYISANGYSHLTHMWGISYSGLRIAGAFSYGIRGVNVNNGWCHEMRVDAFIDACEIGVSLENCGFAYVSATVQPRRAYTEAGTYLPYAKHGIELIRSTNVDLSGSRVWDWDAEKTLFGEDSKYQHLSMIGECRGLILSSIQYYERSEDIRDLIYTDKLSNLEQMTILQEPVTRYFKPKDGEPYFSNGSFDRKLVTSEELEAHFDTDFVKSFTDVLAEATDLNGEVLDGKGYKLGGFWNADGKTVTASSYYGYTGFIPCKAGDTFYAEGLSYDYAQDDNAKVVFYDADFNKLVHVNHGNIIGGSQYYASYTAMADGFRLTVNSVVALADVAYATFSFHKNGIGESPMMAVNEEIRYTVEGFLADSVKVKASSVVGAGLNGVDATPFYINIAFDEQNGVTSIDATVATVKAEMAKGREIKMREKISDSTATMWVYGSHVGTVEGKNSFYLVFFVVVAEAVVYLIAQEDGTFTWSETAPEIS